MRGAERQGSGVGCEQEDRGIHLTLMLRCDIFAASQARGRNTPSPVEMYNAVNHAVYGWLASGPKLRLPSYAEVAAEMLALGAPPQSIPMPQIQTLQPGEILWREPLAEQAPCTRARRSVDTAECDPEISDSECDPGVSDSE